MAPSKAHLLLLRTPLSPLASDPYEAALSPLCTSLTHLPVLETKLLPATLQAILADERAPAERYSGVIITSARAVRAWELAAAQVGPVGGWEELPFFVVGRATSDALLGLEDEDCPTTPKRVLGAESGTGERLAHFMREWFGAEQDSGERKPLLYLVGDKNKETIQQILWDGRIETDRVQVYETEVVGSFGEDLEKALGSLPSAVPTPSERSVTTLSPPPRVYLALFSPSSALPALTQLRRLSLLPFPSPSPFVPSSAPIRIRFIAIGPVTSNYLTHEQGIPAEDVLVAEKPEAESVRGVLERELEGL